MLHPTYWGHFEYGIVCILSIYFLKGFFRSVSKNVLSIFLFPFTLGAYILLPVFLNAKFMTPENFFGILKILFLSFVCVTAGRWIVFLIIGSFLKPEDLTVSFFKKMMRRTPGSFVSLLEGGLAVIVIFWGIDYFDYMIEKNFNDFSRQIYRNSIYEKVIDVNPVYDMNGAKSFRAVFLAINSENSMKKLIRKSVYQKFNDLPVVRKMLADDDFQSMLLEKDMKKILTHKLIYQFFKDEDVFQLVTSKNFISSCYSVLPEYQLKNLEKRQGFLDGIQLKIFSKEKIAENEELSFTFIPDTKVILMDGTIMDGQLVKMDSSGVYLILESGDIFIEKQDIAKVQKLGK